MQGLIGRTQGRFKLGLKSVLVGASSAKNDILNGLSSHFESALRNDDAAAQSTNGEASNSNNESKENQECDDDGMEPESVTQSLNQVPVASGPDPYERLTYKTEAPSSESEGDGYGPSTSLESSANRKFYLHSGSEGSVQSWASSLSLDSQTDESAAETAEFMRNFVATIFLDSDGITQSQKAQFGQLAQEEAGRLWFARYVNAQRVKGKCVTEATFYSLAQHFAIVLFECADSDDFGPAKSLMNMCFTFYHEVPGLLSGDRQYIFSVLKDQPIFHTIRFWNAAFFEALQCERSVRPVATREEVASNKLEALTDERTYQENITFGQLGTFTTNMHAFGLSRELCSDFLRKQCTIASLSLEQQQMLRDNLENLFKSTNSS